MNDKQYNPFDGQTTNNDGLRRFSDELLQKFKGKLLELYIGDQYESIEYEGYSRPQNCSIFGKLVDVLDRAVIMDCFYIKNNVLQSGNFCYINIFQIRAMTEVNGRGSLSDIFLGAKDAQKVRRLALSSGHIR